MEFNTKFYSGNAPAALVCCCYVIDKRTGLLLTCRCAAT